MQPVIYKYTSTKEYHDAFPCAYRQWRADSHCNLIHGYSFSMKFYFGTDQLDVRNWAADYGGLKELKGILESKGLKPMVCKGETFDSELHEAIANMPASTDELKNKIIEDVEKGYFLNEKVIRYAKVVVGQ